MTDETTIIATRTVDLHPWIKAERSPIEGPPLHRAVWDVPGEPIRSLGVVWADDDHEQVVRVVDWDGCTAEVK